MIIGADFETWNEDDLKQVGVDSYTRNCRVLMCAFKIFGPSYTPHLWLPGQPLPDEIAAAIRDGAILSGWNSTFFERLVWNRQCVTLHGFPVLSEDRWVDSAQLAAAANLPRSLEAAAIAVGATVQKDKEGHTLMLRITNGKKTPWPPKPEDLERLGRYCIQDVLTEEAVASRLPPWFDMPPWSRMREIDRIINDRGILLDLDLIRGMQVAAEAETKKLNLQMREITGGVVPNASQIEKLKVWLMSHGVELPKKGDTSDDDDHDPEDDEAPEDNKIAYRLRKSDIADLLARDDIPEVCRQALEYRVEAARAAPKKLKKMLSIVSADGRLRNSHVLGGAQQTFRFSSTGVQTQNLLRDVIGSADDIEEVYGIKEKDDPAKFARLSNLRLNTAIDVGKRGDRDEIECLYTQTRKDAQDRVYVSGPLPWIGRMMRRTITAPAGHVLMSSDYQAIEAKIPFWLSQQTDKLRAFLDGKDLYRILGSAVYKLPPERLTKTQRQSGKIMLLSGVFGGGEGAYVSMAAIQGMRMTREDARPFVRAFREDNPQLDNFWHANHQAAINAVMYPGSTFSVAPLHVLSWCMDSDCLCLKLPSGRLLRYWQPRLQQGYWQDGSPKMEPDLTVLFIMGRAVFRRTLWHGLATQGSVQAIAADILATALVNTYDAGFYVTLHVHDSVTAEVPQSHAERLMPEFEKCMLSQPSWTKGLPLAVSTDISTRFG